MNKICRRLFAYRKMQPWPPFVTKNADWETIYNEERGELTVLPTVEEAVVWANKLILRIENASET